MRLRAFFFRAAIHPPLRGSYHESLTRAAECGHCKQELRRAPEEPAFEGSSAPATDVGDAGFEHFRCVGDDPECREFAAHVNIEPYRKRIRRMEGAGQADDAKALQAILDRVLGTA